MQHPVETDRVFRKQEKLVEQETRESKKLDNSSEKGRDKGAVYW